MAQGMNGNTERMILRFYVRHRMADLLAAGGWTEDQLAEAFEEYVKRRPDSPLTKGAEAFRADIVSWMQDIAAGRRGSPTMRYTTVETEP